METKFTAINGEVHGRGVVMAYCYRYRLEKPNSADIRHAQLIAACLNLCAASASLKNLNSIAETIRAELS